MEEKIMDIICGILKVNRETLIEQKDSTDLWDSLMRVEILFAIEDECNISFTEDELSKLTTPGKLLEAASRKE